MAYPAPNALAGSSTAHATATASRDWIGLIAAPRRVGGGGGAGPSAGTGLGSRVELPYEICEALVDDAALHLEGGRELARILRQLAVEQRELLHLLERCEI